LALQNWKENFKLSTTKIFSPKLDIVFKQFHHQFRLYDIESSVLLTDNLEIHTLEIPKAQKMFDHPDTKNENLLNWMKFLDVKTEEELKMLAQKSPAMEKATSKLLEISADEKARALYESRLIQQLDDNSRRHGAILQAKTEIARNLLDMGLSIADVSTGTGLPIEDVEAIQKAD